ncbi:nitroreductase [Streptomyces sp. NPDC048527]|uniref:nitroreductase family protein n=1 Tax=Streptomyces sp. NPDC048527 TaxID=3365568 RepID=UPI0037120025
MTPVRATTDLAGLLRTRRSPRRMLDGAPDDAELERLLALAMNVPDHGRLRPWRMLVLRGTARDDLGAALAEASGDPRQAAKALRAPLLVAVVLRPSQHPKVPEWEQLATAVAVTTAFGLLLHDQGWGSVWRTGPHLEAAPVRAALRLADGERLLGFLYTGRPAPDEGGPRPQYDAAPHLSVLAPAAARPLPVGGTDR